MPADPAPLKPTSARTLSFEHLIQGDQIYVDKTALICALLRSGEKLLLTRPRGFGKSLLLSTLESLFRHGLRHFRGLAMEGLWRSEPMQTVISLDFSRILGFKDADEFSESLDRYLAGVLLQEGLVREAPPSGMGLRTFANCLWSLPVASTAILIDANDAPLAACLDRPDLFQDVQRVLSRFYARLKCSDRAVRFLFITGENKFAQESIFSGLNNLTDVSLWPEFGPLLGFTEDEIAKNFPGELSCAAKALGLNAESLVLEMKKHYAGYCFDSENSTRVFAPGPVLNFLSSPERGFQNRWLQSSEETALLKRCVRSRGLSFESWLADDKCVRLDSLSAGSDLDDDLGLLYRAGLLTVKRAEDGLAFLGCPNLEAKAALARLFADGTQAC